MKPSELYERVEELFEELCELDEQQQRARLSNIDNEQVRTRVEKMLQQDAKFGTEASNTLARTTAPEKTPSESVDFTLSKRIPAVEGYQLETTLGEGGMGLVWKATQEKTKREVAIKFILGSLAHSAQAMARFHREIELVARLSHPNIVRVFHSGQSESSPFYVMELIKGIELGDYAESKAPSLNTTLTLMATVCDAIQHAHQNGVIHRDLKPSNILVDERGNPFVVDFGIATSTGDNASTQVTQQGQLIGTPAFMSPEQAEGGDDQIDSRSDVFSLGVITYQLVTGHNPHQTDGSHLQVIRRIADGEIRHPRKWIPNIDRDLESVLLKALEHDRERRYSSASEYSADLRRLVRGDPVDARPIGNVDRAVRFCRKRPAIASLMAAVCLLFFVLAIGGPLVAVRQARLLNQIEQEQAQRDRARIETLLVADIGSVADLLKQLEPDLEQLQTELRNQFSDTEPGSSQRLRLELALVAIDTQLVDGLVERLWDCSPRELNTIRTVLKPNSHLLVDALWRETSPNHSPDHRFRAASVLAMFDPENEQWETLGHSVTDELLNRDPIELGDWIDSLRPVRFWLAERLSHYVAQKANGSPRNSAESVLANYFSGDVELLAELLGHADDSQFPVFFSALAKNESAKATLLQRVTRFQSTGYAPQTSHPPWNEFTFRPTSPARQLANHVIALIRLGETRLISTYLAESDDPTTASWIVTRMSDYGVTLHAMQDRLERETDAAVIRGLLIALSYWDFEDVPGGVNSEIAKRVIQLRRFHPDPGVNAAANATSDRWGIKARLDIVSEKPDNGWRTSIVAGRPFQHSFTVEGHKLISIRGPIRFQFGSKENELGRTNREPRFPCVINRNFAIGAHEVTHEQYQRFLKETNHVQKTYNALAPEFPQIGVNWYSTASYCNWLSQKSGLPESEWCYVPTQNGKLTLKRDALNLSGYRLPTEAEWEYACRAGTTSRYSFGNDTALIDDFGWSYENSDKEYQPVGALAPNGFGLFDMHGNARELCLNEFQVMHNGRLTSDAQFRYSYDVDKTFLVAHRGGSYFDFERFLRSAARSHSSASSTFSVQGFRVAQTILAAGREQLLVKRIEVPPPQPQVVDGRPVGQSLELDGASFVNAPNLPFHEFGDFTIEMWTQDWQGTLINQGLNETTAPRICIYPDGAFWKDENDKRIGFSQFKIPTQEMQHIAFVFDGEIQRLFIDGNLVSEQKAVPMVPIDHNRPFRIGSIEGYKKFAKGKIRWLRISNCSRYQEPFVPSAVLHSDRETELLYDFSQVLGGHVIDFSAHERHGTIAIINEATTRSSVGSEEPLPEAYEALQKGLKLRRRGHHVRAPGLALHEHKSFTIESWNRDWKGPVISHGMGGAKPRIAIASLNATLQVNSNTRLSIHFGDAIPSRLHHRAFVVDGDKRRVYIDGKLIQERTLQQVPKVSPERPLLIGQIEGISMGFATGDIFLVEVSSTARYSGDFAPVPRTEPDEYTLRLYDFSRVQEDRVPDQSKHQAHGRIVYP